MTKNSHFSCRILKSRCGITALQSLMTAESFGRIRANITQDTGRRRKGRTTMPTYCSVKHSRKLVRKNTLQSDFFLTTNQCRQCDDWSRCCDSGAARIWHKHDCSLHSLHDNNSHRHNGRCQHLPASIRDIWPQETVSLLQLDPLCFLWHHGDTWSTCCSHWPISGGLQQRREFLHQPRSARGSLR